MISSNTIESVKKWLSYFRTVLADSARPTLGSSQRIHDLPEDWALGQISSKVAIELFNAFAQEKKASKERPETVEVIIVPLFIIPKVLDAVRKEGNQTAIIYIPALIDINGKLLASENPPWIPRELLNPTQDGGLTIATVDKVDEWLTYHPYEPKNFEDVAAYAQAMLAGVSERISDQNQVILSKGVIFYEEMATGTTRNVIKHYDHLDKSSNLSLPLVEIILGNEKVGDLYSSREIFAYSKFHLGSMSPKHELADSQRCALTHHLIPIGGSITAVNGPPGTGKTTFLQSVVASELVSAVVNNQPCPLIMASSTNNQAITNILKAFAEVDVDGADPFLAKRWISHVFSFGIYATLNKEGQVDESKFHVFDRLKNKKNNDGITGFFSNIENEDDYKIMHDEYLLNANQYLDSHYENTENATASLKRLILIRHKGLQEIITALESVLIDTGADTSARIDKSISMWLTTQEKNVTNALLECNSFKEMVVIADRDISLSNAKISGIQVEILDKKVEISTINEAIKRTTKKVTELLVLQQSWLKHFASAPKWMEIIYDIGWEAPLLRRQKRFWLNKTPASGIAVDESILVFESNLFDVKRQLSELSIQATALELNFEDASHVLDSHVLKKEQVKIHLSKAERAYSQLHRQLIASESKYLNIGELLSESSSSTSPIKIDIQDTFWGVLHKLDKSLRFEMFYLSAHYWEGEYLKRLKSSFGGSLQIVNYQNIGSTYRRWSMLTPVFISTFHSAPKYFGMMGMDT